jgi:hypothetical protein
MRSYKTLTGTDLENWFKNLFKSEMGFGKNYVSSSGQISLNKLAPSQSPGEHLELDGMILLNKTCVILEYTSESSGYSSKIEKFIRNVQIFTNSPLSKKEKFKLCGIKGNLLDDFEEVENWKFVFFNTSDGFETSGTNVKDFPTFGEIQKNLVLFRPSHLEYIVQLTELINKYSRNEFLSSLGLSMSDLGGDKYVEEPYIKMEGKYITPNKKLKADIYLVKFKVDTLLSIARVSRHEGIPFILDDDSANYQRLLIGHKLSNISKDFIQNNKRMGFPNTLTLVLSNECKDEGGKLKIPLKFSSIDIIDGQHRLFAYTIKETSKEVLEESEILASVIKFRDATNKQISQYSAKVFCEINSNQAKVKNNLIYLIKYDVLGESDYEAIAGKILLECDKSTRKALSNMLLTNTLKKKTRINTNPIPITTIVDNDLIPFLKGHRVDKTPISEAEFTRVFGNNRDHYSKNYGVFWKKGKEIIETYFNAIQSIFPEDWKPETTSLMQSSKYYSAFIRFLRFKLFDEGKSLPELRNELIQLKSRVDALTSQSSSPSFDGSSPNVPGKNKGIANLFEFLKNPS